MTGENIHHVGALCCRIIADRSRHHADIGHVSAWGIYALRRVAKILYQLDLREENYQVQAAVFGALPQKLEIVDV